MTKEELEKITVEFMNKYNNIEYAKIKSVMGEELLAYAELFEKRIAELEAQIEKMKRCFNCKYQNKFVESKCGECEGYSKWEFKEIKEK